MKRLSILGSTGSIGVQTLDLVARFPEKYLVESLTAGSNIDRLSKQITQFNPRLVCTLFEEGAEEIKRRHPHVQVIFGESGVCEAAALSEVDIVVVGIVGFAALNPTLHAVESGKIVALANKESLVAAGSLIMQAAQRHGSRVLPVDSEHNAVFQLLEGVPLSQVSSIVLTASGGPLLNHPEISLDEVTPQLATRHPTWSMGPKISVDSATLMNKGLEVIEAHYLFELPEEKIEVWIHPQSILHGAVILKDNSILAHLSVTDMRMPIGYALEYPARLPEITRRLSFNEIASLQFFEPDTHRFQCLALARQALRASPAHAIALNASNEVAVEAFLKGRLSFGRIAAIVAQVLEQVEPFCPRDLLDVFRADEEFRHLARRSLPAMS